jgi:flagellar biosynthesis protein FlhB
MSDDSDQEKQQEPTQKRLDDALEKGDVAKSQEVNTWFVIAGATLLVSSFSGSIGSGITGPMRVLIEKSWMLPVDGAGLMGLTKSLLLMMMSVLALPLGLLALVAIGSNLIQHRLVFSAEGLKPKFSKLSPMEGAKRLFGKQALANFVKGLFKLIALGAIMVAVLYPERDRLDALLHMDAVALLGVTLSLTLKLMGSVAAALAFVAAGDYFFQYHTWHERQKMSLQEVKDEFKQSEGDPHIKGRIRQIRYQRMKKRMMAAVPGASVVITNPTHFSVALKYERGMQAPICVAKGADAIAFKIREVAKQNNVPIVENVPLARALYATVDVDEEIPVEHYQAVAEVIGYVMNLRRNLSGRRT